MNKRLWLFGFLMAFLIPAVSSAQKLERTKNWEVGDKVTYNLVTGGESIRLAEEVVEITDTEIRISQRAGDRTYAAVDSTRDLSRSRGFCFVSDQECEWSPGIPWAHFPLEQGKTWSRTGTVTNAGFVTEIVEKTTVESVEQVTTPAGRFQAYRMSTTGQLTSMSRAGAGPFRGTEDFTYWLTSIKGKLVFLKSEYTDSFGYSYTLELVSAELK